MEERMSFIICRFQQFTEVQPTCTNKVQERYGIWVHYPKRLSREFA